MSDFKLSIAFILDHALMAYRVPFFNKLVERGYTVTVFNINDSSSFDDRLFDVHTISNVNIFSLLNYRALPDLAAFDIVVCMQNIRMVNLWTITLNPIKKYRLIHWGIGTSSATGLSLKKTMASKVRNFLAGRASAQVLYSDFPLPLFDKEVREKTFIANNTVYNPESIDLSQEAKDCFLFIGSLNKRKGLDLLIRGFGSFLESGASRIKKLVIIGNGPLKDELIQLTSTLGLSGSIQFAGNIAENGLKRRYFSRAVASISPLQAGLSVLESFSFGVPFICYSNAISGGEHLNIENGENGYLIDSSEQLTQRMLELDANPHQSARLGQNAFNYYMEKRQMKHMVDGFLAAFDYVLKP